MNYPTYVMKYFWVIRITLSYLSLLYSVYITRLFAVLFSNLLRQLVEWSVYVTVYIYKLTRTLPRFWNVSCYNTCSLNSEQQRLLFLVHEYMFGTAFKILKR